MLPNKFKQELLEGKTSIDLNEPYNKLGNRMLTFPLRDFVIYKIKAPLQKAIENAKTLADIIPEMLKSVAKFDLKFGKITKGNTTLKNTHVLIDISDRFLAHYCNTDKKRMLEAALKVLQWEHEHDPHYRWIFYKLLKEIILEIEAGNFILIDEPCPDKSWKE